MKVSRHALTLIRRRKSHGKLVAVIERARLLATEHVGFETQSGGQIICVRPLNLDGGVELDQSLPNQSEIGPEGLGLNDGRLCGKDCSIVVRLPQPVTCETIKRFTS